MGYHADSFVIRATIIGNATATNTSYVRNDIQQCADNAEQQSIFNPESQKSNGVQCSYYTSLNNQPDKISLNNCLCLSNYFAYFTLVVLN